ncbi:hypothetical protein AB6E53_06670 [Vibrio breoganii]
MGGLPLQRIIKSWCEPYEINPKQALFFIERSNVTTIFITNAEYTNNIWSGVCAVITKEDGKKANIEEGRVYTTLNNRSIPLELSAFDREKRERLLTKKVNKEAHLEAVKQEQELALLNIDADFQEQGMAMVRKQACQHSKEKTQMRERIEELTHDKKKLAQTVYKQGKKIEVIELDVRLEQERVRKALSRKELKLEQQEKRIEALEQQVLKMAQQQAQHIKTLELALALQK